MVKAKSARTFEKQQPSYQRLQAFEFPATPCKRHSSSSFSEVQSEKRLLERLCTHVIFFISRFVARRRHLCDDLEAQQGRSKQLASLCTITRFAPSPSGRATRQPPVGTPEPPHFDGFISPAYPPKH